MFSKLDLMELIDAAPDVGVSLFLSPHKVGRETRQNPTGLKNLLSEARDRLAQTPMNASRIDDLLAPAIALLDDYAFWQHQEKGLALFLSEAGMQVHKLPIPVAERVVVGQGFHIAPLIALQDPDAAFVILTATSEAIRTTLATRFSMTDMNVPDTPVSLESMDEAPDYEGSLQSHGFGRPNTGGHAMPKTQVYGDSPEEWRKGRLLEYARRVTASLAAHLARDPLPVVVIADAEIGGHIAKSEALGPMIAGQVEVNPATLTDAELHAAGWDVMQPLRDAAHEAALSRLAAQTGRGDATACLDPVQLIEAAHQGRIEMLYLATDATLHGTFDVETTTVTVAEEDETATIDLLDLAARLSLRSGGKVCVVEQDQLPQRAAMAAILRY